MLLRTVACCQDEAVVLLPHLHATLLLLHRLPLLRRPRVLRLGLHHHRCGGAEQVQPAAEQLAQPQVLLMLMILAQLSSFVMMLVPRAQQQRWSMRRQLQMPPLQPLLEHGTLQQLTSRCPWLKYQLSKLCGSPCFEMPVAPSPSHAARRVRWSMCHFSERMHAL